MSLCHHTDLRTCPMQIQGMSQSVLCPDTKVLMWVGMWGHRTCAVVRLSASPSSTAQSKNQSSVRPPQAWLKCANQSKILTPPSCYILRHFCHGFVPDVTANNKSHHTLQDLTPDTQYIVYVKATAHTGTTNSEAKSFKTTRFSE